MAPYLKARPFYLSGYFILVLNSLFFGAVSITNVFSSEDGVGAILQVQEEARRELECVICMEVPRPGAQVPISATSYETYQKARPRYRYEKFCFLMV